MCLINAKQKPIDKYTCYKIVKRHEHKPTGRVRYTALVMKKEIPLDVISGEKLYVAKGSKQVETLRFREIAVFGGFIHSYVDQDDALRMLNAYAWCCNNDPDYEDTRLEVWECETMPLEGGLSYMYIGLSEKSHLNFASEAVRFIRRTAYASNGEMTIEECSETERPNGKGSEEETKEGTRPRRIQ